MTLEKYLVRARRRLPGDVTTRITKAIEECSPDDALMEFCNQLGISPIVLDDPCRLGTCGWEIFICVVSDRKYLEAKNRYNW